MLISPSMAPWRRSSGMQARRASVRILPRAILGRGRVRIEAREEGWSIEHRTRSEGRHDDGSRHLLCAG
jgi:hypothetical protein